MSEWNDVVDVLVLEGILLTFEDPESKSAMGGLSPRSPLSSRTLRLHLFTLLFSREDDEDPVPADDPWSLVREFETTDFTLRDIAKDFDSIVLVVKSEEKSKAEAAVQQLKEEKLRSLFVVEMEA